MRIIKSEWHSVEKRYALDLTRDEIDLVYPDNTQEENDNIWQDLLDGDGDIEQLIYDSNESIVYLDWDWLDEDDWWTDRKGGYDVTYEVQPDYAPPKTDEDRITDLRNEVNELCKQFGLEERYDTRPMAIRLQNLRDEFQKQFELGEK